MILLEVQMKKIIAFLFAFAFLVSVLSADSVLRASGTICFWEREIRESSSDIYNSIWPESFLLNYDYIFPSSSFFEVGFGGGIGIASPGHAAYGEGVFIFNCPLNKYINLQPNAFVDAGVALHPFALQSPFFFYKTGLGLDIAPLSKKGFSGGFTAYFSQYINSYISMIFLGCGFNIGFRF